MRESSKYLPEWREQMRAGLLSRYRAVTGRTRLQPPVFTGAIRMELEFVMPRPVALKRKLKVLPTPLATTRPDLDKLVRAAFDAAQKAGMFVDDSNVIDLLARKRVAEQGEESGLNITITQMGPDEPTWNNVRAAALRSIPIPAARSRMPRGG